ncbi:MAG TPA: hypothetical protein DD381_14575 [Lentisphaeria bacterium]|nr:MAG: hypothetical protein A2X47_01395 [Lentisphaerae bacterium GWF2_38_69]HBM17550.1 hypothetical protein [Lentisphaeria bacterium]
MKKEEIKKLVASLLNNGISLSDIQKQLYSEYQVKMTFLELRMLASEIESVDWSKQKADVAAKKAEEKAQEEAKKKEEAKAEGLEEDTDGNGKTVVELSKLTRPGAIASGSVNFASGAKADWVIDQFGRLGLEKPQGEPTKEDIKEFQAGLQKIISNMHGSL